MRPLSFSGAGLLLLACLAACDAAGPEPPELVPPPDQTGLVGAWKMVGLGKDLLLTPAVDQRYLDFSRPGEGAIRVSSERGFEDLRYVQEVAVRDSTLSLWLYAHPDRGGESRRPGLITDVDQQGTRFRTGEGHYHSPRTDIVSLDGLTLRIEENTFRRCTECPGVTVSGTLEFAGLPLEAGVEMRVDTRYYVSPWACCEYIHRFRLDGTYKLDIVSEKPQSATGTWRVDEQGDLLIDVQYNSAIRRGGKFTYSIRQDTLRIETTLEECDANCLRSFEQARLLPPRSLSSGRRTELHALVATHKMQ